MNPIQIELITAINAISPEQWDAHCSDYPFGRHAFLTTLELSNSVGGDSGWQAAHILVYRDNSLIAVMPNYLKQHSWGEYVFDWSWADAYARLNKDYYPKLISAIPFTPATGPRLCSNSDLSGETYTTIVEAIQNYCQQQGISGWHILFPSLNEAKLWTDNGLALRTGMQYHWFNADYTNFDDFLARCTSRKRKTLRKERHQIQTLGLTFEHLDGNNISAAQWDQFYYFYQKTYAKRSGHGGYLTRDFFSQLSTAIPDNLVMVIASLDGQAIAGALSFRSGDTLFGRYWGCLQEVDGLHFETCYYQGIDYCIANKLKKFDAGAQGEHKIPRGFEPIATYSCHWLSDTQLMPAVKDFVAREAPLIHEELAQLTQRLPFRKA